MTAVPDIEQSPASERFSAPWQAEVFALTVALNEAGILDWTDWADYLSAALRDSDANQAMATQPIPAANDPQAQAIYYRAWLTALERLVHDRDWAGPLQLLSRRLSLQNYRRVASFGAADAPK